MKKLLLIALLCTLGSLVNAYHGAAGGGTAFVAHEKAAKGVPAKDVQGSYISPESKTEEGDESVVFWQGRPVQ